MSPVDCLFCRIANGEIPADVVRQTDLTVAFRDIEPEAPTHVLVIPRAHHENLTELTDADPALAGVLINEVAAVASRLLTSLLYGVGAVDPMTYALVAASLIAVAVAACWVPASRAMRVDPLVALRAD